MPGVRPFNMMYDEAVVSPAQLPDAGAPTVVILYQGAKEDLNNPGQPGEFSIPVEDASLLDGSDYVRMVFYLYGSAITGAQPSIDEVSIPLSN